MPGCILPNKCTGEPKIHKKDPAGTSWNCNDDNTQCSKQCPAGYNSKRKIKTCKLYKGRSKWDGKVKPCIEDNHKKGLSEDDDWSEDDPCHCKKQDLPNIENLTSWECYRISETECACGMKCSGRNEIVPNAAYCARQELDNETRTLKTSSWNDESIGYRWMYARTIPECPKAGTIT